MFAKPRALVDHALQPAGPSAFEAIDVVGSHLIDDEDDGQLRGAAAGGCGRGAARDRQRGRDQDVPHVALFIRPSDFRLQTSDFVEPRDFTSASAGRMDTPRGRAARSTEAGRAGSSVFSQRFRS